MNQINIIVAQSKNRVIGKDNKLIWSLTSDLKRFKDITTNKTVIMGRKTYESIGRSLPNRENIVITRQKDLTIDGCIVVNSIEDAINLASNEIFIIGGSEIYQQALPISNRVYLTLVDTVVDGDSYFPLLDKSWIKLSKSDFKSDDKNQFDYSFILYEKAQF